MGDLTGQAEANLPPYLGSEVISPFPIWQCNSTAISIVTPVFRPRGVRIICPRAGTLVDLNVAVATASGSVRGAVLDTGQASSTNKTVLWQGADVVAATGWLKLGDPNIVVTRGQHIDLAYNVDSTTFALAGFASSTPTAIGTLPSTFLAPTTAQPKYCWAKSTAYGALAFSAAIAESDTTVNGSFPLIICRII